MWRGSCLEAKDKGPMDEAPIAPLLIAHVGVDGPREALSNEQLDKDKQR